MEVSSIILMHLQLQEYLSHLSFDVNYRVNYVGPMEFFSPTDFANKVFALGGLGTGD